MSVRRMLPFILINVLVSAIVVLAILYWWESRDADPEETVQVTAVSPTAPSAPAATQAFSQSTDTPAPQPDEPLVHVVTAGDTLANISRFYEVPMEDIMIANGISNPNILSVGQQLTIPVGGLPTATSPPPTETAAPATPEEPPTPIATEPLEQGDVAVEISEVVSAGEMAEEAVQILNNGSRQVALLDWKLADEDGHVYTFGQVTLFGDGAGLLVHTETGQDTATDLYWGLEESAWEPGELVTLLDEEEEIQATYTIP